MPIIAKMMFMKLITLLPDRKDKKMQRDNYESRKRERLLTRKHKSFKSCSLKELIKTLLKGIKSLATYLTKTLSATPTPIVETESQ